MTECVLDGLAIYRAWRLLALDEILDEPRAAWTRWAYARFGKAEPGQAQPTPKVVVLLGCPWCLGFWLTLVALATKRYAPRTWAVLRTVFATSAIVGLIAKADQ